MARASECGWHIKCIWRPMAEKRKVRYAVVGAGNIAQVAILPAFKNAKENSELVALVSGDDEKRSELCKKYDLKHSAGYADFEALLKAARVDAVYIATDNATHLEYAVRAAKAGVHVLSEKPLATSAADALVMADVCKYSNVKLMVAYRLHFDEATLRTYELISDGCIGEAKIFESTFTHVVRPGDIRTKSEKQGGGAVLDLGVYCVNMARHVFQAEPLQVFAMSVLRNGSDDTTTATLRFAGDRIAHFTVSNSASSISSFRVVGTDGDLLCEPAYEYAEAQAHVLTRDGKSDRTSFGVRDQFAPQLVHFSDCILNDKSPKPSADEALADLRVIDAIVKSAATGEIVVLEPLRHGYHPRPEQEMRKPAVSKPKTIDAPSPSLK
jgi:predicted dehydrogenase